MGHTQASRRPVLARGLWSANAWSGGQGDTLTMARRAPTVHQKPTVSLVSRGHSQQRDPRVLAAPHLRFRMVQNGSSPCHGFDKSYYKV